MKSAFAMGLLLLLNRNTEAAIQPKSFEFKKQKISVVAVIDTGTDTEHPALKPFIWTNLGESGLDSQGRDKSTNKIDDDGNGYADDLHGWNFVLNSPDVSDDNGHGTHISGIIKTSFSQKITPENGLKLMILKYYDPKADDAQNIENTVKAINYAVKMGAQIINYSGGGSAPSSAEFAALQKAQKQDILVVAAAGNNKRNTDRAQYFPANYKLQNIISVAAIDQRGELSDFSNYGENSVDVAAPGQKIFSTLPNGEWGYMSGTSQATAYVSGFIASRRLQLEIRKPGSALIALLDHSRFVPALVGKTKYRMALMTP